MFLRRDFIAKSAYKVKKERNTKDFSLPVYDKRCVI